MLGKSIFKLALVCAFAVGSFGGWAGAQERVLVHGLGTNPPHLNRLLTTEVAASMVNPAIFDPLVRLDESYSPVPVIATSWEANEEATEYRFTIREGVKFHDGTDLTAEDVRFTLATYLPLAPQTSVIATYVDEITAPNSTTVVVKLNTPFAPFVAAMSNFPIVPKHIYGDGQPVATHPANINPVGSGPFRFESFQSGDRIVVVRNDDYWGEMTDVTRIVFPIIPDQNSRILALESGDIHYLSASYVDRPSYKRLIDDPRLTGFPVLGGVNTLTAHVNSTEGPLANFDVRKALYQALDREMIAERAYFGFGSPSRGAIPVALSWATSPDVDFNEMLPFDPAAAAELLDEAGYPADSNGHRFSIDLAYIAEFGTLTDAAGIMKSNLAEIGVEVNLIGEEFSVWAQRTFTDRDYDLSIVFYTSYEDPSIGVTRVYVCNPEKVYFRNASGICDETLDEYFAEAGRLSDRDKRRAAFAKAENRLAEILHAYPIVDEVSLHFGNTDLWNLEEAHKVNPVDWSLVTAKD